MICVCSHIEMDYVPSVVHNHFFQCFRIQRLKYMCAYLHLWIPT